MPAQIPAEILQQQASATAPGVKPMAPQAKPGNVANGRKQPGQSGKKTAAQKVYPQLPTQDGE